MRRDHHPFWAENLTDWANQAWARHFLMPQFDALGPHARFLGPRHVELRGEGIRAGSHLHVFATRQEPVSLCVNPYDGGAGSITIGDYCVISPGARLRSGISIEIGQDCMLAERVLITDADWHDLYHRIYPGKRAPVRIGDNVWIGDGVTICKGVTIGDNSVIGAASVVTKDVPANAVAAGNPARVVAELDPDGPYSRREHLFDGGLPYDRLKADYDRDRLAGNTLLGWLRAHAFPSRRRRS